MRIGLSERERKRCFREGKFKGVTDWAMMASQPDGNILFQTVSDSAAARNRGSTAPALPASLGVVHDSMLAMHPSGNSANPFLWETETMIAHHSVSVAHLSLSKARRTRSNVAQLSVDVCGVDKTQRDSTLCNYSSF
ncbi:hypothetical protein ACB098_12G110500 [Castanea mollissima]